MVTVDRGRYTTLVDDHLVTAMKSRPLGRKGVVVGDGSAWSATCPATTARWPGSCRSTSARTVLRRTADDDDPVERVIVANADQLVIVAALADPEPRPRLIDRALVAAYDAGLDPLLCLTKADLADPETLLPVYRPLGVPYVVTERGRRPHRGARAAARPGQRADRPQRRRQVHAGQRPGARQRPGDRRTSTR